MFNLTKRALGESLKNQLESIPLKKITVKDIVGQCGVTRRTLYYNFKDIYDLLEWTLKNDLHEVIGENNTYDNWGDGFCNILKYLYLNKKIINNIHDYSDGYIEEHLEREVDSLIMNVINEVSQDLNIDQEHKDKVAKFYGIAFMGSIIDWIENGMKENPEDIAEDIKLIVAGDIYRALEKYHKRNE